MNRPLRRLAGVVALLFVTLFASTTYIQFVSAAELNAKPGNSRQLYAELGRDRGPILVGPDPVARGVPVDNPYNFLRTYPDGPTYAHATGYYSIRYGTAGMERAMNDVLAGTADRLFYRRVSEYLIGQEPQGASVELTIDPRAQRAAMDELKGRRGAVVALDPETGDVLALASSPTYDPNRLAGHDVEQIAQAWKDLNADPDKPMLNRGISELYPPGSTFKVITAAAALSSGQYQPDSLLPGPAELDLPLTDKNLPNYSSGPCGPGGEVTLTDALRTSCNTAFGQLGMDLGEDALQEQAARFGFGEELRIPLRVVPSVVPEGMNAPQLAQAGIGQFDVKATPLQMAMVSAAIANEGVLMKPNLVKSVRSADQTEVIDEPSPQEMGRAVSRDVAEQLTAMMREVVENGTGKNARIPGVEVAGKTGTAQHGGELNHAWFTAFASNGERQVAVAVVIEDGGGRSDASGGATAAPVAQRVMEAVVGG
ncbi:peptidoglycan glycosyltransferase [Kineococcus xinjiangensis]|uniref:Peptidoglycan glycosyltransferase n=1 Tax=Kineococcus xinjiangensis TaxID=512762 RepID=A0A2S6IJD4_9ACTN|nr:penicillin-binding protein 2 [Kineococcus xinjiangensis]PPK94270.1 peptidoglycan glycosyltransferase [Kineococcus xinjiangensis]